MDQGLPGVSIHGILRQEYWSGLPFPSPGDIPDPGIEPGSPALKADSLPSEPPRKLSGKCWFLSTINRLSHAPFHLNIPPTVSPSSKFPLAIYLKVNLIKFVFKLGPNHIQQRRQWHPTPVLLPGKSQGRGAWWAAVHGVAKSRTRLKWLSSSSNHIQNFSHGPLSTNLLITFCSHYFVLPSWNSHL